MEYFPNWAESISLQINTVTYEKVSPFDLFTQDDFVFLFAGNLGEAQNLDSIIDAAISLKESNHVKFVFLGDGRARKSLEQKSADNDILNKMVFFPGRFPIESMPYFMSKASVLLVSLKDEIIFNLTVPSKVQFYMAQGKPILAMLNGDGAELLKTAQCGFSVPAEDTLSFIQIVQKMSQMKTTELAILGENGKNYYEEHFRKEQRIEQLCSILNNF